jgi:hypothetical protein
VQNSAIRLAARPLSFSLHTLPPIFNPETKLSG